jgi:glycosyltransferase involved in cell wall biosynthesis
MPSLYKGSDCFVLPTRGEGWCRPCVEAMSMALPTIVTDWSGPSEFLTPKNSYPLKIEGMDEILDGAFRGHKWARPDVNHLQELMIEVYSHRDEAVQRGVKAREDMVTKYCPMCVANIVATELQQLHRISTGTAHDEL